MSIVVPNFAQIGGFLYFGGQFEFLTILKILKTKSTTLSDDLFLRQVSKGSAVRNEFNIFLHLGYHGNGRHFEFCQPLNSCHTLRWIFLQSFMKFDERNPTFF